MNNDNNNFEDFVKKMLSEEPNVPSGLEWENMDIEIPKKKRYFSLLLFLLITLLLIVSFLSGYWYYSQVNAPKSLVDSPAEIPIEKSTEVLSEVPSKLLSENSTSDNVISTSTISDQKNTKEVISNSQLTESTNAIIENNQTSAKDNSELNKSPLNINRSIDKNINSVSFNDEQKSKVIPTSSSQNIEDQVSSLNGLAIDDEDKKSLLTRVSFLDILSHNLASAKRPIFRIGDSSFSLNTTNLIETQSSPYTIFIGVGSNLSALQKTDNNILNDKVKSYSGLSLRLGIRKKFSNNLHWIYGVHYNEVHTVFTHTREIGRVVNVSNSTLAIECEHIYKNNKSKYAGLNLGIGMGFALGNRFILQTNAAISPSYMIATSGLSLNSSDQVVDLSIPDNTSKFNMALSPSIDLNYSIRENLSIGGSYGYNYSVINTVFVNDGISSRGSHQLFLSLGYKL